MEDALDAAVEAVKFDFGMALGFIKGGCPMTRVGWGKPGVTVSLSPGKRPLDAPQGTTPCIYMHLPSGTTIKWVPAQEDLFAEDWMVVGDPPAKG